MRLLNDLEAIQGENPANQLQVRMSKRHMVTLEFLVHRHLDSRSDHLIEKERSDEQGDDQGPEYAPDPEQKAVLPICYRQGVSHYLAPLIAERNSLQVQSALGRLIVH